MELVCSVLCKSFWPESPSLWLGIITVTFESTFGTKDKMWRHKFLHLLKETLGACTRLTLRHYAIEPC